MNCKQTLKSFLQSFVFAFKGILTCIKGERNFRFHMAVSFHLFIYLHFFKLSRSELCIIIMLCAAVFISEAFNTALEKSVDSTGVYNSNAGAAKDVAACAVLIAAVCAVICGFIILWQPIAFAEIFNFYCRYPVAILFQAVSLAIWIWFVFFGKN